MPAFHFALLAFSSLFAIVNPVWAASIFVPLLEGASPARRRRAAARACLAAAAVLAVFAAAGGAIFSFFGITVPAFQIAGGILFTTAGLRALQSEGREAPEDAGPRHDPSIVPLGIPVIAGPGAISTVMVLVGQADDATHRAALAGAVAAVVILTFLILLAAPSILARLGATGQRIAGRLMGLITAVIGVQFVINGATAVIVSVLKTAKEMP